MTWGWMGCWESHTWGHSVTQGWLCTGMPHLGCGDSWDTGTVVPWYGGMAGTWGQPHLGTWGQLGRGDNHTQGWHTWAVGTVGTRGQPCTGMGRCTGTWGQLGCGDSHTQGSLGGCDTATVTPGDVGTARTQGCRDNWDRGTALLEGTGTVIIRDTGHGDSWDTGTSPLRLSPGLAVAFGLSPLPPATQASPRDNEHAGSGPQGQGHRRPAPGEQGGQQ